MIPSLIYLAGMPLLVVAPVVAWGYARRAGRVPVGLVVFSAALLPGVGQLALHRGDPTEFPPQPYLALGWGMLAGAALATAELRGRGSPWRGVAVPTWGAVPAYLLKPPIDIAFAGV